jgi:hypothetical protein
MKRVSFAGVLAAIVALAVGVLPAAAASVTAAPVSQLVGPSWRVMYRADLAGSAAFTDIEATSKSDAWAVGVHFHGTVLTSGFAAHWNGKRWRQASLPFSDFLPETVVGDSATNVWIVGFVNPPEGQLTTEGVALHLVRGHWRRVTLPPEPADTWDQAAALMAVAFGSDQVLLSAGNPNQEAPTNVTQMWQWTGANWSGSTVPGILTSLSGSSLADMWATTVKSDEGTRRTTVYRWISSAWTRQNGLSLDDAAIAVHSPRDIWFGGITSDQWYSRSGLATAEHWNGKRWHGYTVLPVGGGTPLVTVGRAGVWDGPLLHETDGKWYQPANAFVFGNGCEPAGFFGGLAGIPGTSAAWAASGCTPTGSHHAQARISINGKL